MPVSLLPAQFYQRPSQQWRRLPERRTAVAPQAAARDRGTRQFQVGDAIVTAPTEAPKGAVHFLGGAFAGAAPYLVYSYFIEALARAGYCVVATPYAVSFRHADCAQSVHQAFEEVLSKLQRGEGGIVLPPQVPVHGVGHSNGALMHLLIGALLRPEGRRSNVAISFNNRQVTEAVPLPLGVVQPVVQGMQAERGRLADQLRAPTQQALRQVAGAAALGGAAVMAGQLEAAVVQLGSVFDEVGDGLTDFTPTPAETQTLIMQQYRVPRTLLVRFSDDSIDQTPLMERVLRGRGMPGATSCITLPGNHLTPCSASGLAAAQPAQLSPASLAGALTTAAALANTQKLAGAVVEWLDAKSRP